MCDKNSCSDCAWFKPSPPGIGYTLGYCTFGGEELKLAILTPACLSFKPKPKKDKKMTEPIRYKVGDVVRLRGNEQTMAIEGEMLVPSPLGPAGSGKYTCVWFDYLGHLQRDTFRSEVLIKH